MNIDTFRVRHGDRKVLKRRRPDDSGPFDGKDDATSHMQKGLQRLEARQQLLYAQDRYALLLIFQGMDAAGKDHVIRHVMSGVSPQGTDVHSFKRPSAEELDHDFLWRTSKALPERGRIGIFNRSYYEEVLVVRVHPEDLEAEKLPPSLVTKHIWAERFEDINAFERYLVRNGTVIRKFYLHVSRGEQKRRLLERLDDPAKNWKFSESDVLERDDWHAYQQAFADAIAATSHRHAPWYVVPADYHWFAQALVADVIAEALEALDLSFPKLSAAQRRGLARARRRLAR
ncbi:MAG TPA: polyphosphate kinase 2 family protein [Vicinamibacterales bacterium]|nr:polyphosphate kinase 2 family protein [Vicinamibacterales bacterium]